MLMMGANALDSHVKGKKQIDLVKAKTWMIMIMVGVMTQIQNLENGTRTNKRTGFFGLC